MPERLIHEVLPVGLLECNCHILGDPLTREALVIDPGDDAEHILEVLRRHQLKVRAIAITHAHIDHVGGLHKLHQLTGAPVLMHGDDLDLYSHLCEQAAFLGFPVPESVQVDNLLREGDTVRWGPFAAQVLNTPGHTRGSVSLYLPTPTPLPLSPENTSQAVEAAKLFAGDTLFSGSIGRTDLWGGSLPTILSSIREKLLVLPEETVVYPGHGEETTIGQERESNPFLS